MTDPTSNDANKPASETRPPDKDVYDLAPDAPPPDRAPKIQAPGLTDDFDDDADFDTVPGVTPPPRVQAAVAPEPADPFVRPGLGSAQTIAALGVVALVGAAVLAASLGTQPWYKSVVLSVYLTALQTLAGVGAVVFAARMAEKPLGQLELAAARMLLAVAAARCFLPVAYNVPYTGRVLEGLSVIATYALVTFVLFRLPRHHWFVMTATHAALLVVLWLGGAIQVWASTPGTPTASPMP